MRELRRAACAIAALWLASCATTGHKIDEGMTSIAAGKGLVMFSTGSNKTHLSTSSSLRLVEGSSRKVYDKVVIQIDYPLFKSHFPDEFGHVHTLQLPPGEYFLVPQITNPFIVTTAAPVFRFKVDAGEAAYIGNFWLQDGAIEVSDKKRQRDIDFFRAKNPGMGGVDVNPRPAEFAMTLDKFSTNGTIWGLP